ncbi:PhnD/SsuA/transferrin family substrate-binding protein [Shewanella sp. 4t3-1-2LB]|nr:PhnD/SsuA/transferrin family substrate-binding protein [Shewanella sp. 4t3-1-2LB]
MLLLWFCCGQSQAMHSIADGEMGDDPIEAVFRVAVLANHGEAQAKQRWQPMMDYLSDRLPGNRFEVVPLNFTQMDQQLLDHRIQFIVTNPGQYLSLSSQLPLSWLATMRSRKHNGATYAIGSTIIVKASSPIKTLEDMRGASVVASDPQALGGYQAAVGLLNRHGIEASSFFGDIHFLGFPLEPLVYQVRDGTVDAAITPYCTLEEMVEGGLVKREDFRVINRQRPEGYDCDTSTPLYPNWSFAASDQVPSPITQAITQALFELPADSEAAIRADLMGWTAPVSQLAVIKLYDELQLHGGPPPLYDAARKWFRLHRDLALLLLAIFFLAPLYHLWLEYKIRQKNEFLLVTERQLKDKELQLERMQSAAIVGEIGAGLAHELNQPIAAITQYSEGALMALERLDQQDPNHQQLHEVLTKIYNQSMRAGGVVHRIRGLLRRRRNGSVPLLILPLLQEALALFQRAIEQQQVALQLHINGEEQAILGDSVGLSQVLVNLLKNALDAMENSRERQLQIRIDYQAFPSEREQELQQSWLLLEVSDTGSGLTAPVSQLMESFATTKEHGLGLGLAICRDVMTEHQGLLQLENRHDRQGCRARLWLPYQRN